MHREFGLSRNKKKSASNMIVDCLRIFKVSEMRFELTQPNGHYPLKVACLPIPPPGQAFQTKSINWSEKRDSNPRPRPWQGRALPTELFSQIISLERLLPKHISLFSSSEKRDSNPRPRPWQGRALPTELFSRWAFGRFSLLRCKGRDNFSFPQNIQAIFLSLFCRRRPNAPITNNLEPRKNITFRARMNSSPLLYGV